MIKWDVLPDTLGLYPSPSYLIFTNSLVASYDNLFLLHVLTLCWEFFTQSSLGHSGHGINYI